MFPASLLRADSESPVACLRPSEEKLAACKRPPARAVRGRNSRYAHAPWPRVPPLPQPPGSAVRQAERARQHRGPGGPRAPLPRQERPPDAVRLPAPAAAVPRRRHEIPAPILLLVPKDSYSGPHTRRRRSKAVLLGSRRDPFAAHARVEQPGPARCGINHEVGQSITNSRMGVPRRCGRRRESVATGRRHSGHDRKVLHLSRLSPTDETGR